MKILVTTPYYFPHFGGSQAYIHRLYAELRKHHPEVEVDVLCYNTKGAPSEENLDGIHIIRIPCWEVLPDQFTLPNPLALIRTISQLRNQNYDIVNAHTRFFDVSWWTPFVAKYFHAKSLFTDHCASLPEHQSFFINLINQAVDHILVPVILPFYNEITAVSDATGRYLKTLGAQKYTVIPGALPLKKHTPTQKLNSVTFAGRLIPSKNPNLFLAAAHQLLQKHPDLNITIAGDGPMLTALRQSADSRVVFTGALSADKMAKLLQNTTIFVHPSEHHEGLPQVLLEAGQAGCALLATNQGGSNEIVVDGKTGLLIQPTVDDITEKVEFLLSHQSVLQKLRTNAMKHIQLHYNLEDVSEKYFTLLSSLI